MLPYLAEKIFNLEDVKEHYPNYFDIQFLKRKQVKKFYTEELEKLLKYWTFYKTKNELREIATARALYDFLWCIENVTSTMISYGWDPSDILTLMGRMRTVDYDPYSISDATGEYLNSLPGHGYIEIERKDGSSYMAYNPKGKGRNHKMKGEPDAFIEEYDEPSANFLPDDDDWDDKGARPGELEF